MIIKPLSALAVAKISRRGFHAVGVIPGVGLYINKGGSRYWILRYSFNGRRRHYGIGPYPEVSLADAREAGRLARDLIRQGTDPISARQEKKRSAIASSSALTFQQACDAWIAAHRAKWRSDKHVAQIESTLRDLAGPVMGKVPVAEVTTAHVMRVLEPRWRSHTETQSRLQGRIASVLDWATVHGHRTGENPARWKGHLEHLLPAPSSVAKKTHFAAMPWKEVPTFWTRLQTMPGVAAKALQWTILSACRSGEARGMSWAELNEDLTVWTVPAERAKTAREHRVPVGAAMRALLPERGAPDALVWPGAKGALSDMALTALLRRMQVECTAHGFRSSFRTWASECTSFPHIVLERCLAHVVESEVAQAYQRSDHLEQRRVVMERWADYVRGVNQVVTLVPSIPEVMAA